jgi:hypothetical protein
MPTKSFCVLVILSSLFSTVVRADNISPALALPASGEESFPPVKLRAYGTLSAEQKFIPDAPMSSVMTITCESEPKAQLVLAKYLSDLGELPGTNPLELTTARGKLEARQLDAGGGAVAAARIGTKVYIFTAVDGPALQSLYETTLPAGTVVNSTTPEIPVPMYVDRWDKYGFRYYYGPFNVPQDANHRDVTSYDPSQDFTFAKQSGDVGLVVWTSPVGAPGADGITDLNHNQWVYDAAKKLSLPLGINLGIGDLNFTMDDRYCNRMAPNAEGFLGGWYGAMNPGGLTPAWSDTGLQDIALGQLQPLVRDLDTRYPNIVNWLEPHEEMGHGVCDLLDDQGPAAKESFHNYLKQKYGTLDGVSKQWSMPAPFTKWDDVPFPELATFMNWNAQALDLTGIWKISYTAPYGADSAKPDLDDSSWDDVPAPGHSVVRSTPRQPAVFRRHITIDAAWHAAHPKVWLYLWDFNDTRRGTDDPKQNVYAFINGKPIPESGDTQHMPEHYCALEVSSALVDGDNQLTICLPQAMIDYRCYLSGQQPLTYPQLGPTLNAEWADFTDWLSWSRGQSVRRGMQMIRQVDPDRPITLMAPGSYLSDIKEAAEDYGGIAHDTGGMAGSWGDAWPNMMQSSGLPTDCEPGSGAVDLNDFKRFMGRWETEATQGVDYFQHIGDVEWKPEVKDYFGKTLNLWHLMGKYHLPQAELAIVNSDRNMRLLGFPWDVARDPNAVFSNPAWWGLINNLLPTYPRAGITERDFARGNADQYRVVLDGNTTIMDPDTVDAIEKWVKAGGTFITYQQTGRHTSTKPDSWPISKITGYTVTGIDRMAENGDGRPSRFLHLVKGQHVYDPDWSGFQYVHNSAGLSLKKWDPACEDLLQWNDGSIAAGIRHLGKGMVVTLGTNSWAAVPPVLEYLKVKHVECSTGVRDIVTRHFISNNGLWDIWVLWNSTDHPLTATLTLTSGVKPDFIRDVNTGENMTITYGDNVTATLKDLQLDTWQTRAFISPRGQLANAPGEWLRTQRGWWRGTENPGTPIPPYQPRNCVNLTEDWAFKPVDGAIAAGTSPAEDASQADPKLNDSSWQKREIGVFDIPDFPQTHRAFFRKHFTIPAEWTHGHASLDAGPDGGPGSGLREYLDGQSTSPNEVNTKFGATFTPGSSHILTFDLWNANAPVGPRNSLFLTYTPDPISSEPVKNNWAVAEDDLKYGPAQSLPISMKLYGTFRTTIHIGAEHASQNVILHTATDNNHQHTFYINGRIVMGAGNRDVNITPWVKFGQDNEVIVYCDNTTLQDASVEYYDPAVYP